MQTTQLTKEHIKAIEEELIILIVLGKVRYKSTIRSRLEVYKQIENKLKLPIESNIYITMNALLRKLDSNYTGVLL